MFFSDKIIRFFSIFLLANISNIARADWTAVGNTVDESNYYYVEKNSIRKVGNFHYYWRLVDKLEPDEMGYFSIKYYIKADCETRNIAVLSLNFHKQQMGVGEAFIYNYTDENWLDTPPGSVQDFELDVICTY